MAEDMYSDFYDFVVTGIDFVLRREPNPKWATPARHYVDPLSNILVYALEGAARYEFDGRLYDVHQGDVMLFPRGFPHTGESVPANPWAFISVGFDVTTLRGGADEQLGSLRHHWRGAVTDQISAMFPELHVAWTDKKPGYLVRCRALVMSALYALIREQTQPHLYGPHSQKIVSIISTMRRDYDRAYSVDALAQQAGLSPSHFRALFKQFTGLSVKEYQHRIKVSKAKELLLSGECNVTEAAARTGFSDIYYFSRLFKKVTGTNPSKYTKR
jgi:AraC-like DNA-binding protein